ncbi:MAG: MOSC N-terminal beta barrel domain-containing protein [Bacteroidota bacterium]
MQISSITVYPIKSLGGVSLQSATLEPQGLQFDRRWMLIDPEEKKFLTQRQLPEMALLRMEIGAHSLVLSHLTQKVSALEVPLNPSGGEEFMATVWNDTLSVESCGKDAAQWFSDLLGRPLELVYMPRVEERSVKGKYAPMGSSLSLADRSPYLIIGQSSLDDLNTRLDTPVPMDRFRPNFVFEGGEAYAEDTWKSLKIGENAFHCGGPCGRCKVITIDQNTAEKGNEPFATLATYRRPEKSILFGQMLMLLNGEMVTVGDKLDMV